MNTELLEKYNSFLAEYYRGKHILVSGSTGLIGSRVVAYLDTLNRTQQADITIIALYRSEEKKQALLRQLQRPEAAVFVQGDVEDPIAYDGRVDHVIHCAGISGGTKMHLKDPVKIFDTGIGGTRNLLEHAVAHGCQGFLYVSTYEVYGESCGSAYISETASCQLDTVVLRNCYAEIKRLCESLICAFSAKYGLKTCAVRLTSTFGHGVKYDDPRFFAEFARCILEERDIVLKSHGTTVRSYLDADDAALAFLYVLAKGETCSVYNLTNPENEISILEIAERMIRLSGSPIRVRFDIAENVAALGMRQEGRTVMDASKIAALGWQAVCPLDETLKKLIESMRKSRDGKDDKNEKV